ncbi:MAG: sporulation peptidase YabG [Bacillota bacterium]|nr:sporulation peptidase YabG [Bacillota bacterium]
MNSVKIGDIVSRKSYGCDILFRVAGADVVDGEEIIILNGLRYRIQADAQESDLQVEISANEEKRPSIALTQSSTKC